MFLFVTELWFLIDEIMDFFEIDIYIAHDQQETQVEFKKGDYMPIWIGVS